MKNVISVALFLLLAVNVFPAGPNPDSAKGENKGKLYFYWGWNRGWYTPSDIRFTGVNYDFTLENVVATDRQTPFGIDPYFNPLKVTIPQTNFRIGYFFKEHYNLSFGDDHMKYVMRQNQITKISGTIDKTETVYDRTYNDEEIRLTDDFLTFEHTNGLNYLNVELTRFDKIFACTKLNNIELNLTEAAGIGVLLPKTNTRLLNNERYDAFHVAGYGISLKAGVNITFFKHFFVQSEVKGGYINMPDIRTTLFKEDKAQQHFLFLQTNILFGVSFRLARKQEVAIMSN